MERLKSGDVFYSIDDYPWDELYYPETSLKPGKRRRTYLETPATFDIETTTIDNGEDEYPEGFMYRWMVCFQGYVCMGSYWEECVRFFHKLRRTMRLNHHTVVVVYVHNLSFEFQFMQSFFKIFNLFAKDKRKVLKFDITGFEFRCSYFLSNMSLQKFCENCEGVIHGKISGDDYDYKKRRTPETKLTDLEKQYQYNDVAGLEECIYFMMREDTMATMPLTNTGYVRRECKRAMRSNPANRSHFVRTKLTLEQYKFMRKVFRGGDTHASRFYSDMHLYHLDSYDLQSSYPAWIMTEYYPMGKLMKLKKTSSVKKYKNTHCLFLKLAFFDLKVYPKEAHTYIDQAHSARYRKIITDNGRILKADYLEYYCTEIDLEIINETYDYTGYMLLDGYMCTRGKIPEELKQVLMDFYDAKTTLKGLSDKIYEYMKSKNRLNAIYGMMVSAIIHNDISVNQGEWLSELGDEVQKLFDFYGKNSGFLPYQWGIYVTAHARKQLRNGIRAAGTKAVYWDTDSVKFIHDVTIQQKFEKMNEERIQCIEQEPNLKAVSYKNGKPYYMGIWEEEHHIEEFKTFGAKKYCTITKERVKKLKERYAMCPLKHSFSQVKKVMAINFLPYRKDFMITVAGMNKAKGAIACINLDKAKNPVENFKLGAEYANVGRTTAYYNDDISVRTITVDGCTFTTGANIGMVDTTYTLGITNDYAALLESIEIGVLEDE